MTEIMVQQRVRLPSIRELAVGIPSVPQENRSSYTHTNNDSSLSHGGSFSSISSNSSPESSRQPSLSKPTPIGILPPLQIPQDSTTIPVQVPVHHHPQHQNLITGPVFQQAQLPPVMAAPIIANSSRNGSLNNGITLHHQPVLPPPPILRQPQPPPQSHHNQPQPQSQPQPQPQSQPQPQPQLQLQPQPQQIIPGQQEIAERHVVPAKKKRPRRKANEMVRLYACNYKACRNSYGTLNHLNAHITFKRHGPKRKPEEFKQIRELYKLKKKLGTVHTFKSRDVAGQDDPLTEDEKRESGNDEDEEEALKTKGKGKGKIKGDGIKLLADLSGKLGTVEQNGGGHEAAAASVAEVPIFHQQRGYNGYGRHDHTLTTNDLDKIAN